MSVNGFLHERLRNSHFLRLKHSTHSSGLATGIFRVAAWMSTIDVMPVVRVEIPLANHEVTVEPGALKRAGEIISKVAPSKKAAILTDTNVAPLHLKTLVDSLSAKGIETAVAIVPAGEQ